MTHAIEFAPGLNLRVVERDGKPWFVARDVQQALRLTNIATTTALLDADEKGIHTVETRGGAQPAAIVSESGLYSLLLRSRRPEAKVFKKWVTSEVLPAIRKTGGYMAPSVAVLAEEDPAAPCDNFSLALDGP